MQENLLVNLEFKKNAKKWRNISIVLLLLVFLSFSRRFASNRSNEMLEDIIAEIKIEGVITEDDYRDNKIVEITNNDRIKAVILEIDSPGGMVTPSEVLYDLIFALNKKKPVVVLMDSMATSGAYMAALGADYLIARNTTTTGSVGVLLQGYNFSELAKKVGVELKAFKSSELKGMPSYFEPNTERSDIAIQSMIDDIFDYFSGLLKERRKMTPENFKLATDGQAFTGRQALKIGLIDEIGDKNAALKYLESREINSKLPVRKIELYKKARVSFLQKIIGEAFFNFEAKSKNDSLMLMYSFN